jgi:hypothetical protein
MADDGLLPLPGHTEAATTTWLHRRLPELDLEVVGLRSPTYVTPAGREGYGNQVAHIARLARGRRLIFIGDLGTDPATDTRGCAEPLQRLFADGFALTRAQGDWSHRLPDGRTTRVDPTKFHEICRGCSSVLEFDLSDVQTRGLSSKDYAYITWDTITCPTCSTVPATSPAIRSA